ncbi:MAG: ribonuclease Z, partial [Pseudomonadota bacterium]
LGGLAQKIARISPGQKISYITDVIGSPENREKIYDLAREADHLYIEAAFLDADRDTAGKKYHLTAGEAGDIARNAGARRFTIFHFSPRYRAPVNVFEEEAEAAFSKDPQPG